MFIAHHRQNNQNITNNCHQNEDGENDPEPDSLRVRCEVRACWNAVVGSINAGAIKSFIKINVVVAFVPHVRVCHFEAP